MTKRKKATEEVKEDTEEKTVEMPENRLDKISGFSELIYKTVFECAPPVTDEKIKISVALSTLRMNEISREQDIEYTLYSVMNECREPVIRMILESIIKNNMRFVDCGIILSSILRDSASLAVWEYENVAMSDEFFGSGDGVVDKKSSIMDIFKELGDETD